MKRLLPNLLFALLASAALADYAVLFYNNWYFADVYWPKWLLLGLLIAPLYFGLLSGQWQALWRGLAIYWGLLVGGFMLVSWHWDLAKLTFTGVLNLEVPMIWLPIAAIGIYAISHRRRLAWQVAAEHKTITRALKLRQRLRRMGALHPLLATASVAALPVDADVDAHDLNAELLAEPHSGDYLEDETMLTHPAAEDPKDDEHNSHPGEPPQFTVLSLLLALTLGLLMLLPRAARAEGVDSTEPWHRPDRHAEFKYPSLRWHPDTPTLEGKYPEPLESRPGETFSITLENKAGGEIRVGGKQADGTEIPDQLIGHVLSPATQVSKEGFTASGWAVPSTVCATAVNAMHIKTKHDYTTGKSSVFSILPKEFANFDPKNYNSFYAASGAIVTDLPAGSGIFGGLWAPLVGSKVSVYLQSGAANIKELQARGDLIAAQRVPLPLAEDYSPSPGDVLVIHVVRKQYNPEWIEFENRFGGIVWVKEIGLDPYPIAEVLKPVAGSGRFGGSEYAERGRLRANHPGVICVSTSDKGQIGGFQIIPRDHSMSPEMTAARTKSQWMVIGPLWAFDKSWEGLPPLFTDYLYPAYIPTDGKLPDGEQVDGAKVFLGRLTVRARYSDSKTPDEYELLHGTVPLGFDALATLTNLRIYFPRE